jgi:hypothetical protein
MTKPPIVCQEDPSIVRHGHLAQNLAPRVGLEPTTNGFTVPPSSSVPSYLVL